MRSSRKSTVACNALHASLNRALDRSVAVCQQMNSLAVVPTASTTDSPGGAVCETLSMDPVVCELPSPLPQPTLKITDAHSLVEAGSLVHTTKRPNAASEDLSYHDRPHKRKRVDTPDDKASDNEEEREDGQQDSTTPISARFPVDFNHEPTYGDDWVSDDYEWREGDV